MTASISLSLLLVALLLSQTGAQDAYSPTSSPTSSPRGGPVPVTTYSPGPAAAPYSNPSTAPASAPSSVPTTTGGQSDILVQHLDRLGLTTLSALLAPLQPASYLATLGKPVSILAPTNDAFAKAEFTLDTVQLALLNDTALRQFATNLLTYHIIVGQAAGVNDFNVGDTYTSALASTPVFFSDSVPVDYPYGIAAFANDPINATSWAYMVLAPDGSTPSGPVPGLDTVSVIIVDNVLFPSDVSLLLSGVQRNTSLCFGTDPAVPTVVNGASAEKQAALFNSSYLPNIPDTTALSLLSSYGLAPLIFNVSATSGATVFLPSDQALLEATPTIQLALQLFGNATFQRWTYNLLLLHIVDSFQTGNSLIVPNTKGFQSLLGPSIYSSTVERDVVVYTAPKVVPVNYPVGFIPTAPKGTKVSVIVVKKVVFPYNASSLLPPSAIPTNASCSSSLPKSAPQTSLAAAGHFFMPVVVAVLISLIFY